MSMYWLNNSVYLSCSLFFDFREFFKREPRKKCCRRYRIIFAKESAVGDSLVHIWYVHVSQFPVSRLHFRIMSISPRIMC